MTNANHHADPSVFNDPVFYEIFLPLYKSYKMLDREFDRKVINRDIDNLRKKFETIANAKKRRR